MTKAKTTKAKTTKTKARRYVSPTGECLGIVEDWGRDYQIGWWLGEEEGYGAIVGESKLKTPSKDASDEEKLGFWEVSTAYKAIEPFADSHTIKGIRPGFSFETKAKAVLALRAANEALLNGGSPMPTWAVAALEAGWTPPKGWKP